MVVPPHTPAALAAALDRLSRYVALRARLGEAARTRVETTYDARDVGDRVAHVYARVLGYSRYPRPRRDSSIAASSSAVKG